MCHCKSQIKHLSEIWFKKEQIDKDLQVQFVCKYRLHLRKSECKFQTLQTNEWNKTVNVAMNKLQKALDATK